MKQQILNLIQISLFLLVAVSITIPKINAIEFCTTTEQIVLQDECCNELEADDNQTVISDAECCDEIALSDVKTDSFSKLQLKTLFRTVWFTIPDATWTLVDNREENPIAEARGPPLDQVPLFIQNCSYLI